MESIALLFVLGALLVIGSSWLAPKIGIAAPILLVVLGIGASFIPGQEPLDIPPELILTVVLPPILYAAAVNVPMTDFRRNFGAISGLSVVLVVLSSVLIGFLLTWLLPGLPLPIGIALGAVVSPPDAVAATSIGKRLGLPPRLVTVLEGEGLVNDTTALVLLRSAVAAAAGGFAFLDVASDFAFSVVVALLIGAVVGVVTVWVRSRIDQPTLTTAISFVVPFLAFLPAEALDASGVLAVVVAGLVTGFKATRHLTAQDRISERMNWRTIQLVLENGVFLVMGYEISTIIAEVQRDGLSVWAAVGIGLIVVLALLIIRMFFTWPLLLSARRQQRKAERHLERADQFLQRIDAAQIDLADRGPRWERFGARLQRRRTEWQALAGEGLGWRGGAVIAWSGMRGVVTLAAAQSLPDTVPFRPQLVLIAFTVAVFTLVFYGSTLPLVIRWLGISGPDEEARNTEVQELVDLLITAGSERLNSPELRRADGEAYDPEHIEDVTARRAQLAQDFWEIRYAPESGSAAQRNALFREMLSAEQAALIDARASGQYSSEALELAQMVLDTDLARTSQNGTIG